MTTIQKKRPNTRLQIIQLAARLFLEDGYAATSLPKIGRLLNLSTGNITFYFKSKDHLLAVLVEGLFEFQNIMIRNASCSGHSTLLAYCLELASMVAVCEEDEAIRSVFASAYSSETTLSLIRKNDTAKTKTVFASYRPDWTEIQWVATENIVSGIEYATIMTREQDIALDMQIERTLNAIMLLYGVPDELRETTIQKVLSMDCRGLGHRFLEDFKKYIDQVNEQNLEGSIHRQ